MTLAIDITIGTAEESPLHLAAKHNSCEAVKALIQNDALLDVNDFTNRSPLHYACEYGSNEAVEVIRYQDTKNTGSNVTFIAMTARFLLYVANCIMLTICCLTLRC